MKVLLADDAAEMRMIVSICLRGSPFALDAVENGAAALERFRAGGYAAVLLDMHMPVMDGPTAARAMRALESAEGRAATPLIALTAGSDALAAEQFREAGFDDVLSKPTNRAALLATLQRLTGSRA